MWLGRPWLTVAIDCASRLIVGFYLSFDPPSANSALQCLRIGVLPKDQLLAQYQDISTPWPACGMWVTLVLDNGMEMHGKRLLAAATELGIHIQFCPSRQPWNKAMAALYSVETMQRVYCMGLDMLGPQALEMPATPQSAQYQYLSSFMHTIGGGTSEIRRNIIGERGLGLPRER
jgi:hypothetical protein